MSEYLPAYGMTHAELDALNERVCVIAGLRVDKCPVSNYHDAMNALLNLNTTWVVRTDKTDCHVKISGYGEACHSKLCIAIYKAIARKEQK